MKHLQPYIAKTILVEELIILSSPRNQTEFPRGLSHSRGNEKFEMRANKKQSCQPVLTHWQVSAASQSRWPGQKLQFKSFSSAEVY